MKDVENLDIRDADGGAVIAVKAVPGASRDRVVGVLGNCLKIATAQPAERGKANQAIAATLAKALGVGRKDVALLAGPTNPRKEFRVVGLSARRVRELLAGE